MSLGKQKKRKRDGEQPEPAFAKKQKMDEVQAEDVMELEEAGEGVPLLVPITPSPKKQEKEVKQKIEQKKKVESHKAAPAKEKTKQLTTGEEKKSPKTEDARPSAPTKEEKASPVNTKEEKKSQSPALVRKEEKKGQSPAPAKIEEKIQSTHVPKKAQSPAPAKKDASPARTPASEIFAQAKAATPLRPKGEQGPTPPQTPGSGKKKVVFNLKRNESVGTPSIIWSSEI